MQTTANYGLWLTEDASTKFLKWREKMNGTEESNMVMIDRILGDKADNSVNVSCTLTAAGWVGEEAPYVQTLAVEGLKAEHNGSISLAPDADVSARRASRSAALCVAGQADGALTVYADETRPEVDIPVIVTLIG